jgi:transposase
MAEKLVTKSETQLRGLKLRVYPAEEQEILMNKTFGCVRKVYNNRIAERQAFYETVIRPEADEEKRKKLWKAVHFSTEKELKVKFEYLKDPSTRRCAMPRYALKKPTATILTRFLVSVRAKRWVCLSSNLKIHTTFRTKNA